MKAKGDEVETEILEPYQVSFSDLLFSSRQQRSSHSISANVIQALGPSGPGLLCITGVLGSPLLRRKLLPMARKLALLDPDKRKLILKEHHLGSDVPLKNPERDVSSFSMQLNNDIRSKSSSQGNMWYEESRFSIAAKPSLQKVEDEFKDLGDAFKELGFCMRELGLWIARVCDREIGGGGLLENTLLESCTAKARLVHYHSAADKSLLREAEKRIQSGKRISTKKGLRYATDHRNEIGLSGSHFNLWQQWHYDYGIFTVLTDPMFLSSYSYQECTLMNSHHSYLQIYHPSKNKFYMVKTPHDSFIVQIGESADILSKGKLRSTLHCVCKPEMLEHISRETFVVFLQPSWNHTFSEYTTENQRSDTDELPKADIENKVIPPLSSRLRDGMTFAEFAQETTKQYYGRRSGLQSNR